MAKYPHLVCHLPKYPKFPKNTRLPIYSNNFGTSGIQVNNLKLRGILVGVPQGRVHFRVFLLKTRLKKLTFRN